MGRYGLPFSILLLLTVQQHWGVCCTATQQQALLSTVLAHSQRQSYPAPDLQSGDPGYLAICLAIKDQAEDVREWALHHLSVGATKLYIYEHNSSRPALPEIQDLVDAGDVEYEFVQNWSHPLGFFQLWTYDTCIRRHRQRHRWMAFIDTDEFFVMRDPHAKSMPDLLREYEDKVGLAVNWQVFGSSGHLHRPAGGALGAYTKCLPADHVENRNIKTIANLAYVDRNGGSSHMFLYLGGRYAVNSARETVGGTLAHRVAADRLVLAHYVLKSRTEFAGKTRRGGGRGIVRDEGYFERIDAAATADCGWAAASLSRD